MALGDKIQQYRTNAPGTAFPTLLPGQLAINMANNKVAFGDNSGNPVEVSGIRFFSTLATYAIGDYVVQAGVIYKCTTAVTTPGAFSGASWTAQGGGVAEAPNDASYYTRHALGWSATTAATLGALTDAPNDTNTYGRKGAAWVIVTGGGGGIADAPSDSKAYVRLNAAWAQNNANAVTWTPTVGVLTPVFVSAELDAVRTKNTAQDTSITGKVDTSTYTAGLALKADKTYVDSQDATKAATTYVDSQDSAEATARANADTTLQTNINGKAPAGATYVTLTTDATLTSERTLAVGAALTLTDAGAGLTATIGTGALTGDVTSSANSLSTTIANNAVTNAKVADMAASTVKGRQTSTGDPQDLTTSNVLDFVGATRGQILYRGASNWSALAPGSSGNLLQSGGASGDPSWVAAPAAGVFTASFTSADQGIVGAGAVTLPHGLGAVPALVEVLLVCVTGDQNYSAGDVVVVAAGFQGAASGVSITIDATNLNIRYGSSGFSVINKTSGVGAAITLANWKMRFKAWV